MLHCFASSEKSETYSVVYSHGFVSQAETSAIVKEAAPKQGKVYTSFPPTSFIGAVSHSRVVHENITVSNILNTAIFKVSMKLKVQPSFHYNGSYASYKIYQSVIAEGGR